ncbi:hypothetical protein LXA43DRAFT_629038 [Ganoderma leucocontextum]|nr:hypothetical protein LXA43DRAFT_629038 [Ganoderma leucocontextum]
MAPSLNARHYKMFASLFRIRGCARAPIRWSAFEQGMRALDFEIVDQKGTMCRFVAPICSGCGALRLRKIHPRNPTSRRSWRTAVASRPDTSRGRRSLCPPGTLVVVVVVVVAFLLAVVAVAFLVF